MEISHSEFTRKVIELTRHGVAPEGGRNLMAPHPDNWEDVVGRTQGRNFNPQYITIGETRFEVPEYLTNKSGFTFGRKSENELVGVKPELVQVARVALVVSTADWMVWDGLRTEKEQAAYVKAGTSKTMNSKHREQPDGLSHAIDAVPVVGTLPKWDWNLIYPVVCAIDFAATALGFADNIRWGGAWDRSLADFGGNPLEYKKECELYANRHPGKDFLDGPHFEWIS